MGRRDPLMKFHIPEGAGSEIPILSEVRRWASKSWNQSHGLNIYEMGYNRVLFEFASATRQNMSLEEDGCGRIRAYDYNGCDRLPVQFSLGLPQINLGSDW
ncbi:hypothetical protein T459_23290 [Capsicum annuum]|uniref:DUF4283 domain-containing protein n=1 Tax=Capsicum annuum TaxID=4072 RepID=A0A2G2YS61_CAPAN|nr:hypothetical protein T459_23290 [Capsicum annuum]